MSKRIGIIGVGIMGEPMAKNLIDAGYEVTAYDINREAVDRVGAYGCEPASSPREAAASKDLVITMLPDDRIVQEAIMGTDGAMEGMSQGAILIDMSTVSPTISKKMAEALEKNGMEMLDAPVSGGPEGAGRSRASGRRGGGRRHGSPGRGERSAAVALPVAWEDTPYARRVHLA